MPNESLASHALVKLALENIKPLLDEAQDDLIEVAKQGVVRREGDATLLEYEFYDDDVFSKAGALVECLDRLEQSQRLIETAGQSLWDAANLDRHTWIEYHYSFYVVTVVSLADISLMLTNSVFRLGISERDCKPSLITKNWWVAAQPDVKAALDDLSNLIKPYRVGRNLHVHQGKLQPIAKVMGSKMLDQLSLFSFVERAGKPVVPGTILAKGYSLEVPKITGRLEQERTEIRTRIEAVFDALFPVYKHKAEELHEKWRPVIEKKARMRAIAQTKADSQAG